MITSFARLRLAVLFAFALLVAAPAAPAQISLGPKDVDVATVTDVENGSTLVIESGERVHLQGISIISPGAPAQAVREFDAAAAKYLSDLVKGKRVWLQFEPVRRTRDGELAAYVFVLSDGTFVNGMLVRDGYAVADTSLGYSYTNVFTRLQWQARRANVGLWQKVPRPAPRPNVEQAASAAPASSNDGDDISLDIVDLRRTPPAAAPQPADAGPGSGEPRGAHTNASANRASERLNVGGSPNDVKKVTTAVRNKVNDGDAPTQP